MNLLEIDISEKPKPFKFRKRLPQLFHKPNGCISLLLENYFPEEVKHKAYGLQVIDVFPAWYAKSISYGVGHGCVNQLIVEGVILHRKDGLPVEDDLDHLFGLVVDVVECFGCETLGKIRGFSTYLPYKMSSLYSFAHFMGRLEELGRFVQIGQG